MGGEMEVKQMNLFKWLDQRLEETLMMIMLAVICGVMGFSVVSRYVFDNALSWAEEICRYMFIWSAFLSASLCLKRRSSIKIDMLVLSLGKPFQRIIIILGDFIMIAFFAYMLHGGILVTTSILETNQTSPALLLPMYWVYAATIVGFSLSLVRLVQRIYFMIKTPGAAYEEHLHAGKEG